MAKSEDVILFRAENFSISTSFRFSLQKKFQLAPGDLLVGVLSKIERQRVRAGPATGIGSEKDPSILDVVANHLGVLNRGHSCLTEGISLTTLWH